MNSPAVDASKPYLWEAFLILLHLTQANTSNIIKTNTAIPAMRNAMLANVKLSSSSKTQALQYYQQLTILINSLCI